MLTVPQRHVRTDRRTVGRTTYDSNTAVVLKISVQSWAVVFDRNELEETVPRQMWQRPTIGNGSIVFGTHVVIFGCSLLSKFLGDNFCEPCSRKKPGLVLNFNVLVIASDISIFPFPAAIFGCRSLLQLPEDTFFIDAIVENPRLTCRISIISIILLDTSISGLGVYMPFSVVVRRHAKSFQNRSGPGDVQGVRTPALCLGCPFWKYTVAQFGTTSTFLSLWTIKIVSPAKSTPLML